MSGTTPSRDHITAILGLPKYIVVGIRKVRGWLRVLLAVKAPGYRCPQCGQHFLFYHDRESRPVRDLSLGRWKTILEVPQHRIDCDRCGRQRERLSFVRKTARCTRRFEQWLFRLTRDMTLTAVARLMDCDWKMVKDAEIRHIVGLLRKRKLDGITRIGIDEVSEKKGHRYLTLVTDLDGRRVIWVGQGNRRTTLRRFFRWFGPERTKQIKVVVTDMHDAYIAEVQAKASQAVMVVDHFHFSKPVHNAIDEIRRRVQNQLPPKERKLIKGMRYVLLRPRADLRPRQQVQLQELLAVNQDLTIAYILKEEFREVFRARTPQEGRELLADWEAKVAQSQIPELVKILGTFETYRWGIENFFQYRVSNGMSEGFNNVVKTIKKMAYGFHDSHYFGLKILRICGKLEPPD